MDNSSIDPIRFLRYWMWSSVLIWPLAALVCIFALVPFAMLFSLIVTETVIPLLEWSMVALLMLILSILIGYVVGERQERLVDKHLDWILSGWTRWSILGGAIGGLMIASKALLLDAILPERALLMMNMPLFVLCLSIAQWQVLRKHTRESWLWVLGNLVGGIVFSGVLFLNQPAATHPFHAWLMVGLWAFATLAQSAITGIIMLWLYERPLGEWNDDNAEAVPVYVEVRTRSDNSGR